jgi:lipoprotein-anchoring transpeptidase ErfK/SrfK
MQRVGTARRRQSGRQSRRARWLGVALGGATLALVLSACTSSKGDVSNQPGTGQSPAAQDETTSNSAPSGSTSSSSAAAQPTVITTPVGNAVNPGKALTVRISNGKLTDVAMLTPAGRKVHGAISADGASWHNTEDLGYAKTYRITASGVDASGGAVSKKAKITTVTPNNQTMPFLQRIGGYPLTGGATYGVAIVPVVHFDEPITNKAAAERSLKVTTSPHVAGAWYWADDQNAHWRPQRYWPSGTTVTVSADVYGVNVGHGLYGQSDASTSFKIGRRQVTVADDTAPKAVNKVRVYDANGHVVRTMNTSMGKHSGVTVNGNYINFYTLDGTYTVLGHEQPARMCSASYGLPANAQGGYPCENIYNATKISTDGIYLHELLTTVWDQDHGQDVSHGCLNLNAANSKWFFNHSMVGDPVEIHGAKGAPTLQIGQGGDWTIPWSTWAKGGALN